jgi:hypothetical protein
MDQDKLKQLQDEFEVANAKLDLANTVDIISYYGDILIKYGNEIIKIGEDIKINSSSVESLIKSIDSPQRLRPCEQFVSYANIPLKIPASSIDRKNIDIADIDSYQYLLKYQKMLHDSINRLTNKLSGTSDDHHMKISTDDIINDLG